MTVTRLLHTVHGTFYFAVLVDIMLHTARKTSDMNDLYLNYLRYRVNQADDNDVGDLSRGCKPRLSQRTHITETQWAEETASLQSHLSDVTTFRDTVHNAACVYEKLQHVIQSAGGQIAAPNSCVNACTIETLAELRKSVTSILISLDSSNNGSCDPRRVIAFHPPYRADESPLVADLISTYTSPTYLTDGATYADQVQKWAQASAALRRKAALQKNIDALLNELPCFCANDDYQRQRLQQLYFALMQVHIFETICCSS